MHQESDSRPCNLRLKKSLKFLSIFTVSFLICSIGLFALFEAFPPLIDTLKLQVIPYYWLRHRYVLDSELIFRYQPNSVYQTMYRWDWAPPMHAAQAPGMSYRASYDENGFRNQNKTSKSDVIVLGDSFIEFGVDEADTFNKRLSRNAKLDTTNFGVAWYGPFQYLAVLQRYGLRMNPRYSIFSFFEGNDIDDVREYLDWKAGGSYWWFDLNHRNFLQRYTLASREVVKYIGLKAISSIPGSHTELEDTPFTRPKLPVSHIRLGEETHDFIFGNVVDSRSRADLIATNEWKQLSSILSNFRSICIKNQIIPIVLFIPTKTSVYGSYCTSMTEQKRLNMQNAGVLESAMQELCSKSDLKFVTLTPLFESLAAEGEILYYPFDSHWNSEGREAAAVFVASQLVQ